MDLEVYQMLHGGHFTRNGSAPLIQRNGDRLQQWQVHNAIGEGASHFLASQINGAHLHGSVTLHTHPLAFVSARQPTNSLFRTVTGRTKREQFFEKARRGFFQGGVGRVARFPRHIHRCGIEKVSHDETLHETIIIRGKLVRIFVNDPVNSLFVGRVVTVHLFFPDQTRNEITNTQLLPGMKFNLGSRITFTTQDNSNSSTNSTCHEGKEGQESVEAETTVAMQWGLGVGIVFDSRRNKDIVVLFRDSHGNGQTILVRLVHTVLHIGFLNDTTIRRRNDAGASVLRRSSGSVFGFFVHHGILAGIRLFFHWGHLFKSQCVIPVLLFLKVKLKVCLLLR
mmetsp:Transcript_9180/g.17504  ORF Transcript_9180/g.17504 Transcript_9180/m.17504 type:complete len:338 (+) Transcript_9180:876-1889(+)